jgi:hypothetical protein
MDLATPFQKPLTSLQAVRSLKERSHKYFQARLRANRYNY